MSEKGRPKKSIPVELLREIRAMHDGQRTIREMCERTGSGNTVIRHIIAEYEKEIDDCIKP